jgi:hypothetical protein
MEKLQENINRIKELMLVENDNQLSLFTGDATPINLNSDEFTLRFKEKVYFILKDLYKSNWDSDRSRGPGGGGGVVNIHTVFDLLQKKGLTDYDPEGGDWSILNYFDTNPQVRKTIVGLYEKETGKIMSNTNVMEEFIKWMSRNRNKIFKDGPILKDLIEKNVESLYQGELNERKAYDFLTNVLKNIKGWTLQGRSVPGSKNDRDGVDFVMVNENGDKAKFQVKPLGNFEKIKNGYKVESYNIKNLDKKPVDYFVFASSDKNDVYVFKKTEGKYTILDDKTIQFENDPIQF